MAATTSGELWSVRHQSTEQRSSRRSLLPCLRLKRSGKLFCRQSVQTYSRYYSPYTIHTLHRHSELFSRPEMLHKRQRPAVSSSVTSSTSEGVDGAAWPPALRRRLGIIGNPPSSAASSAEASYSKAKVLLVRSSDNIDDGSPDIETCELKVASTGDNINSDSDSDFDSFDMPISLAASSSSSSASAAVITAKPSTSI